MTTLPAGPPAVRPRPSRGRRSERRSPAAFLRRWVSPVVLVLLWQLASETGALDERKLASPTQIAATAVDLVRAGTLGTQTLVSIQRVAIGFAIGALIGVV